jgi:streptogramin lyase
MTPGGSLIKEYPVVNQAAVVDSITAGPDGNLWYVTYFGQTTAYVGRIAPDGSNQKEFLVPNDGGGAQAITMGPDGNLWFTLYYSDEIGQATPSGTIQLFGGLTKGAHPEGITTGPDGNLWFTEIDGNSIGRITPDGQHVKEFPLPTAGSSPTGIAAGPDGNLWFSESTGNRIGQINTSGNILKEYSASNPFGITAGPDRNLWFAEVTNNKIGRITTAGIPSEFAVPTLDSQPNLITTGPDGNLWFTEFNANQIGRLNRPVLSPISDQTVNEGSLLTLTATATDTDTSAVLTYSLDSAPAGAAIDPNTGVFTYTPADGPASYSVIVRVTDNGTPALSDTKTFNITVNPVAPTASISGPTDGYQGVSCQPRTFTLSATEPSAADQAAGFTYAVIWGDGASDTLTGPSGTPATHVYNSPGFYTVTLTATDEDGAQSAPVTLPVTINETEQQGSVLAVGGTVGDDSFVLTPGKSSGTVQVNVNGVALGTFTTSQVLAYGGPGNDTVNVNGTAGADSFTVSSSSVTISGVTVSGNDVEAWTANGLAGNDTFTVTAGGLPISFDGGTGTNTLVGPSSANAWHITGANSGDLNGDSFLNIQNLTGGSGADTFQFRPGGSVGGRVNGAGGSNTLDYSSYGSPVTVNLQSKTASGMSSFTGIAALVGSGSGDTLGGANTTNAWQITGANAGTVGNFSYTAVQNLVGGTGVDSFVFSPAGSESSINGGGAPAGRGDWLDYSSFTTNVTVNLATGSATNVNGGAAGAVTNIQDVISGSGTDTLTGDSQGNILIGHGGADTINGGSGLSLLIGGTGASTINGGSGGDILIGGKTSYDTTNHTALMIILAEWQSADSYAVRTDEISDGTIVGHAGIKLHTGSTVTNNPTSVVGSLNGFPSATLLDWFFMSSTEQHSALEAGEIVNDAS